MFLVDGIWLSYLGTAESSITIMAASVPVLRALVRPAHPAPPGSFYNGDLLESQLELVAVDQGQPGKKLQAK